MAARYTDKNVILSLPKNRMMRFFTPKRGFRMTIWATVQNDKKGQALRMTKWAGVQNGGKVYG